MRRNVSTTNVRIAVNPFSLQFTNIDNTLETRFEQQWVLSRLPFETTWAALMIFGSLAELFVRNVLRERRYLVLWRWVLLSAELITCMLLYLIIINRGDLASCSVVKRCFQDIVLIPMCTLIISPLIMRRQLWLSATLLALTTVVITSTGGLAVSVVDVASRDTTCTIGGPLLWLAHGLDMVWRQPSSDIPTLKQTAAPLLLFLHIVLVFCVPLIVQYIMELHCRIRFLQTVGVRSIHRGPQGRVLQKLLIVAALTSPAMLLLLWRSLQFLTGSFLGVSNIRFY